MNETVSGDTRARPEGPTIETRLTSSPIDRLDPFGELATTADGAVIVFQGRVRDHNDGREVRALEYEAYGEMAERELRSICEEAADRFEVGAISAVHRVGPLELGEASVAIGVAAPHRAPCYEASRYIIEQLKVRLPVWKHERYVDGETAWVAAPVPPDAAKPAAVGAEARPRGGEAS